MWSSIRRVVFPTMSEMATPLPTWHKMTQFAQDFKHCPFTSSSQNKQRKKNGPRIPLISNRSMHDDHMISMAILKLMGKLMMSIVSTVCQSSWQWDKGKKENKHPTPKTESIFSWCWFKLLDSLSNASWMSMSCLIVSHIITFSLSQRQHPPNQPENVVVNWI